MTKADAVRSLAATLRNEANVRTALVAWMEAFPREPGFVRARGRLKLGSGVQRALEELGALFGADAPALAALLVIAERTGCPAAPSVDALAASLEARARDRAAARAAAAAARNSARAMVLMPVTAMPLYLLVDVPFTDAFGLGFAAAAGALMYAGWRWIDRLVPDPPGDDDGVRFCELLACALRGGATPASACAEIAALFPGAARRSLRLTRVGMAWPQALARADDDLVRRAGELLVRMERRGNAVAAELAALAHDRRLAKHSEFDVAVKAAPVRMIWPLVVCSLPAFCALTVVPLVRGIASSL